MGERGLQQQVFDFFRFALPDDATAFCVPNGDGRMTTAPGTLTGVPDICIIYRGRPIFIELKTKTGAVRASQRWVHDLLMLSGAIVHVCRSLDDVQEFLGQLMPLKARVA